MKSVTILILTVIFFVLSIPTVQGADQQEMNYTSLKDEYVKSHPGQAIIPFPWEPSTSIRVLPFKYEIPAAPCNNFSIAACRNQFESASFIINAQKDLSGITINVPNLYDAQGNSIPSDAINVRTAKVWYQAAKDQIGYNTTPGYYFAPELLLKDDSLVIVDYVNSTNYLKVTINGSEQYIDISNPGAIFPLNAQIHDAPSLQPFSLKANENKQIWLTVHVPNNTPAGDYKGKIAITSSSEAPVIMTFSVTVLPFTLESSPIDYSLYYWGVLPATTIEETKVDINSQWKTSEQYAKELQNMKDHGVLYPTIDQWYDDWPPVIQSFNLALSLREQTGFPTDHIYFTNLETGNSTNITGLSELEREIQQYKKIAYQYEYQDVFSYGIDEAKGEILESERPAWETVHTTGAKVFAALGSGNKNAINIVGNLLDVAVVAGSLNTTQAAQWHSYGKQIFSYANPESGIENPEIYRKNYGFALWNAGYDGAMVFAYQERFGQSIWNDFDTPSKNQNWVPRDHVFAYPTSNGVIDTIQWEGWREGVDDTRYLATLIKLEGSDNTARAIVSDSLSKGEDLATIREKIIAQILITSPADNEIPKMGIYQNGMWYWDNNRNGVWDASTDTVYSFGASGWKSVVGDWNGDDKTEVGVFQNGVWYLDYNGNGVWDTGIDKQYNFGTTGWTSVVGDWNGDGKTEIGVYQNGVWYLDWNGNGMWDAGADKMNSFGSTAWIPVVGDWNGDGKGTKIGIYKDGVWYLDYNGNGKWDAGTDKVYSFGATSWTPVTSDWNGDGKGTKICIYKDGVWYLDWNGNGMWDAGTDKQYTFGATGWISVVGNWNGDGKGTKIGIYKDGVWYLDWNGNGMWDAGTDKQYNFGATGWSPVIGK